MESLAWLLLFPLLLLLLLKPFQRKKHPPGPFQWPLVGNLFTLTGDQTHIDLMDLAQIHGPLMYMKLGALPTVVASTPKAAEEVLKVHDKVLSGRCPPHSVRIKGHIQHSVVWSDCNETWKMWRKLARTELFSTKMLDTQVQVRDQKVAEMVDFLRGNDGKTMGIMKFVFGPFLNIMGQAIFSKDVYQYYGENADKYEIRKKIREMSMVVSTPNISDFFPVLGDLDLQGLRKRTKAKFDEASSRWADIIKERRENNDHSKYDFLEVLLTNELEDAQINAIILETFGPGLDTSSQTIEWAMAELLKNPDKMAKLRKELDREVGKVPLKESHLPRLHYLHACIKEAMRMHPIAPFLLPRRAVEACEVMGFHIPKDCQILLNTTAIGRDPEYWKDPHSFLPERFLDSDMDYYGNHYQFIPFGAGRRICLGLNLANRAIPLILGSLIHSFDWSLPDGMQPADLVMRERFFLTLEKDPPLAAVPTYRL